MAEIEPLQGRYPRERIEKSKEDKLAKVALIFVTVILIIGGVIFAYFLVFEGAPTPKLGVIKVNGSISGFEYARLARKARNDRSIEAVVLKVNSEGGTVTGTFQAETSLSRLREEKPLIASLQEQATSGAYVVASASDYIYAWDQTLTAGLGVIATWVSYEDYYENMGIDYFVWKSGEQKDMFAPWRKPTPEEDNYIEALVKDYANKLYQRIKINRPETVGYIDNIRDGKTLYGNVPNQPDALDFYLIDNIGGMDEAVEKAAEMANLDKYQKVNLANYYS